jgi:hypothetical protein
VEEGPLAISTFVAAVNLHVSRRLEVFSGVEKSSLGAPVDYDERLTISIDKISTLGGFLRRGATRGFLRRGEQLILTSSQLRRAACDIDRHTVVIFATVDVAVASTFVAAAVFLYVQLVSGFSPAQHEVFSGVENSSF